MNRWLRIRPQLFQSDPPAPPSGSPKPEPPTSDTPPAVNPPNPPEPEPERVTLKSVWDEIRAVRETLTGALSEEAETLQTPAGSHREPSEPSLETPPELPPTPETPPIDPAAPMPPVAPVRKPAIWAGRRTRT